MKLHLPIALLTAMLGAFAYAEDGATSEPSLPYSYVVTQDGDTTKTVFTGNGYNEFIKGYIFDEESGEYKLSYESSFNDPVNSGTSGSAQAPLQGNIGGLVKGDFEGTNTDILITGEGTQLRRVHGVGPEGYSASGHKTITVTDKASVYSIFGLAYDARAYPDNAADTKKEISISVTKGGMVGQIIGTAFSRYNNTIQSDRTINEKISITVDGATLGKYISSTGTLTDAGGVAIMAAGQYGVCVNNDIVVNLNNANVYGLILAGSYTKNQLHSYVNSTTINIKGNTNIIGDIYGGSVSESDTARAVVKNDTIINLESGSVIGNIYGAGWLDVVEGNTKIVLAGGTVQGNIYAGGEGGRVLGNAEVVIKGTGTTIDGIISGSYKDFVKSGTYAGTEIVGDKILAFDSATDTAVDYALGKAQDFNAVGFYGMTVDFDDDKYDGFNTLYVSGSDNPASPSQVSSNEDRNYDKIVINEGGNYSIEGGTHKVTGPGVNGAEEVIVVNGSMSIAGESTKLQVQGASSQVAIGNGGSLVVSDGAAVDMSAAGTIYMGYSKGETGSIELKNGASFKGGYNNAWLGGGTVDITNSTMEVSNSESGYNYRTLMGLSGNTLQMNVTATDGGDSTFKSAASQLVLNYNDGTNVELVVSGAGATFEQAGTIVTDKSSYSIGTSGIWEKKTINELVTKEVDGKKVTEVKQVERWCDSETEGYVGSGNGTTDTVTYICAKGTNEFGGTVAAVNDVKATITAKDGGSVVIGSKLTYVGSSYDAQALAGKEINKLATFNVEDSASSMSFQGMEIYTNAQVNNKGGKFSATNVNVRAGGNLTFNVSTSSAVMTAEKLTVYTDGTLSFVRSAAAEGTSLAMEAPATTTVTLNSDLVLLAGSTLELDLGMLVNLGYNNLTIQDGAIIKLGGTAAAALTMTDAEVEALATTLFQTAGTFTALDKDGNIKADGIAIVNFNNNPTVGISSGNGVANVPEPTTATLSLLALAGLCARRRRK